MNKQKKCGTCKHWFKDEVQQGIVGAPKIGKCRQSPPVVFVARNGTQEVLVSQYPPVAEIFDACSQHEERSA